MVKSKSQLVSIIMANYNNANYIGVAIESVTKQTYQNWELIIVDDASTDNSLSVIKPYLTDSRIHLYHHRQNKKYIETLLTCLKHASGDIVGILDADDALDITAVRKIVNVHGFHPDASLVYTNFWYCDANLNKVKIGPCQAIKPGSTNLREDCVSHFKTFKRSAYVKTAGFDPSILAGEDFDLITKLEEQGKLIFIDEPLFYYRRHDHSLTHGNSYNITAELSCQKIKYRAYLRRLGTSIPNLTKPEITKILYRAIYRSFINLRLDQARYFIMALYANK